MDANELLTCEPHLTTEDKALRDRYVSEYLKDYNNLNAAVRMNYTEENAVEFAKLMAQDPYVQRQITEANQSRCTWIGAPTETASDYGHDDDADKRRIVNRLFEEAYAHGAGSSQTGRVSALKELARIYRLGEREEQADQVVTNVMIVPGIASVDEWEQMAKDSQAKLKEQVKQ